MKQLQWLSVLARELFPYALIFYLVMFLLENLLPGFVSNNFNLNWILIAVLGLGFVAAFAPDDAREDLKPTIPSQNDYALIAGLGVAGAVLMYFKLDATLLLRLITAGVVFALIMYMGMVILSGDDEEQDEYQEPKLNQVPQRDVDMLLSVRRNLKHLLLLRVRIPIVYLFLVVVALAVFVPKNILLLSRSIRSVPAESSKTATVSAEIQQPPFFWDDMNNINYLAISGIPITLLNGGAEEGSAASYSAELRARGFTNITTGNADKYDYTNAQIRFKIENKPEANVIKQILQEKYPEILELPLDASQSGIVVILGALKE